MEKLYTSKTFLKMAGGGMHTPHPMAKRDLPDEACNYDDVIKMTSS